MCIRSTLTVKAGIHLGENSELKHLFFQPRNDSDRYPVLGIIATTLGQLSASVQLLTIRR
ncbi:MAG: hypothetical protein QNJ46_20095 [Leptolyngbyaceae cyanobacterium MO_188.B28]|nr:hypothetical protein [Leptolyngbyaceae cyanobacterium MO_188.B28]